MHPLCTHVLLSSMAHSICAVPSKNGARSITQNKFERTMITYTISLVRAGFCLFFLLFLWGGRKLLNVTDLVSLLTYRHPSCSRHKFIEMGWTLGVCMAVVGPCLGASTVLIGCM